MWWLWIPIAVVGTVLVLFLALLALGRFRNGALLRPVIARLARIPWFRRFFTRVSTAAIERQNPDLAGALKKLETVASNPNPQAVQKAMSRLTPAERRAYMQATESQAEEAPNRQARRRVEKMQQQARAPRPGGSSRKRKRR